MERGDVGGNAAAVDTDDNDLATDDAINGWVVGNNSGDDDTGDEDAFGNFDADDTTDDKVVDNNATNNTKKDEGVGVNVVVFDTVDD